MQALGPPGEGGKKLSDRLACHRGRSRLSRIYLPPTRASRSWCSDPAIRWPEEALQGGRDSLLRVMQPELVQPKGCKSCLCGFPHPASRRPEEALERGRDSLPAVLQPSRNWCSQRAANLAYVVFHTRPVDALEGGRDSLPAVLQPELVQPKGCKSCRCGFPHPASRRPGRREGLPPGGVAAGTGAAKGLQILPTGNVVNS
ncbi:hypothetical protein FN846DRAFT_446382 [Sphaerosporella brunnea]|uniref:Uncharacterized protein n=1 Tax=Sphaerosporella brunnea TaxID=1250544 RepID=A0A5J5EFI2_9PEZI|nr:hypothetical protein FN846DRAFT_446382 [Sphaerosporella brunnea]